MIDLRQVRSVTEFQRNIKDYVGQLKKKGLLSEKCDWVSTRVVSPG